MSSDYTEHLKALGEKVPTPVTPSREILETFPSPSEAEYEVTFETAEITSMCPKTGQPDFGSIAISYQPDKLCLESKSLKLYLQSYRNERNFWEAMTNRIADDLAAVLKPVHLSVRADMNARGGVMMTVVAIR